MKNLTFIVVDDAVFMRTVLKKMLAEADYQVVAEAGNGIEAIQLAEKFKPHMMTLDITMPEMDGLQAIESILNVSPETKIIMCSAMGQQSMVMDAIRAGAKDFIVKPFQADRVLEAIKKVVG